MVLLFVQNIPNFAANLLSIAHITHEFNWKVIFYSNYSFFQDLVTGTIINIGSLSDSLYYLDSQPTTQGQLT